MSDIRARKEALLSDGRGGAYLYVDGAPVGRAADIADNLPKMRAEIECQQQRIDRLLHGLREIQDHSSRFSPSGAKARLVLQNDAKLANNEFPERS